MIKPQVIAHGGVFVVRDDLIPGGTKARFLPTLFDGADEVVYASPAEGGAQTALATVAGKLGKRATIFVARRKKWHDRALMAKRLRAKIEEVPYGYRANLEKHACQYSLQVGARLLPFGLDTPVAIWITGAANKKICLHTLKAIRRFVELGLFIKETSKTKR